jgi:nickel-dependent lactate racemase
MPILIVSGRQRLELEAASGQRISSIHGPPALRDPGAAVRAALEAPFSYPPLRRALTPEDRVAIVVDEQLPDLAGLLVPILEHIGSANIPAESITLVCPRSSVGTTWIDDLPDEFDGVCVEVHDPADRRRLSYLATTAAGRRLYLNRTVIDADQVVVLTGRRYDPWLGYGGAEGAIFPTLSDTETLKASLRQPHFGPPGREPWPLRQEAIEATWLLGQPFYMQAILAVGNGVARVVAGASDACREGDRQLDDAWRPHIAAAPQTVVAALSGDPRGQTFGEMARALTSAANIVQPGGRIILVSDAPPALPPGTELIRDADDPRAALAALEKSPTPEMVPAMQWARAAGHARVSLLGNLPDETVEELFASPLAGPEQVQRLVSSGGECVVLHDAQRMMAVIGKATSLNG